MWCNQIFSLIGANGLIQNISVCDSYETANQLAITLYGEGSCAVDTTQYPLRIGYTYRNGRFFNSNDEEIIANPTDTQELQNLKAKTEVLDLQINPTINTETCTLEELKEWQINLSKTNLESYLNNNPIKSSCHGGEEKYYSITKEKQSLLTQMILVTQLALQNGTEYQPSWNAAGEACTYDWTLSELQQLAFEMEIVVRPLVSHQQTMETEINAADTKEAVLAVSIEF